MMFEYSRNIVHTEHVYRYLRRDFGNSVYRYAPVHYDTPIYTTE